MATYKLTSEIAEIVYGHLSSIIAPKFLFTKPPDLDLDVVGEYVVVNSLPVNARVMQKCYVNVNYYVKDISGGPGVGNVPDTLKIQAGAKLVLAVLKKVTADNYLIDFESEETIREEKEHYANLRFSFKVGESSPPSGVHSSHTS